MDVPVRTCQSADLQTGTAGADLHAGGEHDDKAASLSKSLHMQLTPWTLALKATSESCQNSQAQTRACPKQRQKSADP